MTVLRIVTLLWAYWWRMMFSENRCTLFGIMREDRMSHE